MEFVCSPWVLQLHHAAQRHAVTAVMCEFLYEWLSVSLCRPCDRLTTCTLPLPCDSWNRLQLPEIEWISGRKSMDKGINKEIPDFADSQWISQTMTPGKGREMLGDDQQNNHTSHSSLIPCSFHWWPQLDKDGTPCNDDVQSDITAGCVYRCSSLPLTILHLQPPPPRFLSCLHTHHIFFFF